VALFVSDIDNPPRPRLCTLEVTMDGLPPLTGIQCIEALGRAGYGVRYRNNTVTVLERGSRMIVVPDVKELSPSALSALLQAAGLSYAAFLQLLKSVNHADDARTRSGMRLRYEASEDEADESPNRGE
jgi:hypothetical protein